MTHQSAEGRPIDRVVELLAEHGFEGMAQAMQTLLDEAMKLEREEFLGARPHQRSETRRGWANGFKPKRVESRIGVLDLAVPQVRALAPGVEGFYPSALERGLRSERALKLAVAEMYVQGVSTRRVVAITQQLCGLNVTSSDVSRAAKLLDEELSAWRARPLGEIRYLALDAHYEKIRHGGAVIDVAVLIAVGVTPKGQRTILGVSAALSEAEVHWRDFLASLQDRGLHGVQAITSDDHAGLRAALAARFAGVRWQRCQFHLQRNAMAYVPRLDMRAEVARDLRSIFNAPDREEADRRTRLIVTKYRDSAPRLAEWIEANVPEGLTVFSLPPQHRVRLRTSNGLERLNAELERRTRVATIFPNESSLLRLVSAVLIEIDQEWETARSYLTMENR